MKRISTTDNWSQSHKGKIIKERLYIVIFKDEPLYKKILKNYELFFKKITLNLI